MTNPDRDELVKLADRLAALPTFTMETVVTVPGVACNARERDLIVTALRRLASSDGGVKGEPEPVAWPANLNPRTLDLVQRFALALAKKLRLAEEKYDHTDGWLRDDWESECRDHLYQHLEKGDPRDVAAYCAFMWHHDWITCRPVITAPPADAGMREALKEARERLLNIWAGRCPGVGCENDPVAFRDWVTTYADAGVKSLDKALTAPGATTKSDGGQPIHAIKMPEYHYQELDMSGDHHGVTSNYSEYTPVTVRGSASDPSSTRREVTVESLADWLNKRGSLIAKAALSNPGRHSTIDLARSLLDQFEIRRK